MIKQDVQRPVRAGANFSAIDLGPLAELDAYKLEVPAMKREVRGKLFIRELLSMTGMEVSMNKLPAGASIPFYHQHKENEEAYIFVGGSGQMQVDGDTFDVQEGSIVRVGTAGSRVLRNTSTEPLYYICVQARENSLNQATIEDGIKSDASVNWPNN
jgi:mannose-6-phosphate isomerase-like protein (cupin superfamily)